MDKKEPMPFNWFWFFDAPPKPNTFYEYPDAVLLFDVPKKQDFFSFMTNAEVGKFETDLWHRVMKGQFNYARHFDFVQKVTPGKKRIKPKLKKV
jgi:hypothetical protein